MQFSKIPQIPLFTTSSTFTWEGFSIVIVTYCLELNIRNKGDFLIML